MESRGRDAGAPDAPAADDTPAPGGDDESVAVDPLPSTGSLVWADDTAPARRPGRAAADPPTATASADRDDTTEVIVPDQVVSPPDRADEAAPPGWARATRDPRPGDRGEVGSPGAEPWGPPTGPPLTAATTASAGPAGRAGPAVAPTGATGSPSWDPPAGPPSPGTNAGAGVPAHGGRSSGPRHVARGSASAPGGERRRPRTETIVLAAVGVVVVVVGVAAMALGGGDDPSGPLTGPSTTSAAAAPAGDGTDPTGPIVGPTGIVGWWSGSEWVSRADGETPDGGVDLSVVGIGGEASSDRGVTVAEECASQEAAADLDVSVDVEGDADGPPAIAVAGVSEPLPRPVEQFEPASPPYPQAAAEVAAGLGVTTPPTVTQVLRSDLDGSGTKEVVVSAGHVADPEAPSAGDWSVVFLRRVVGDGVATSVVASSVAGAGDPAEFQQVQVSSLADLNGDGTMELVVDGRSTEGRWTSVHALGDDGVPAEVLREGCDG